MKIAIAGTGYASERRVRGRCGHDVRDNSHINSVELFLDSD